MTSPSFLERGQFGKPAVAFLSALLLIAVARLWIPSLRSSFWVDEMVTVFVVHHGAADPSLAVAPQVPESIYYSIARAADALFGVSEAGYRIPSLLFSALALLLIARLAARLIDPRAAWFAVFACLALRGFNQESADARPYAMGFCVVAASLLFLVRWLDSGSWVDAAAFVVCAAMVWRVHLLFWPFYIVFALYAAWRVIRFESKERPARALAVFAILGLALVPQLLEALSLYREAGRHVIVAAPDVRQFIADIKWQLILECGAGAAILAGILHWKPVPFSTSSLLLIACWWLVHPLCLFLFSWLTGDSVFVQRYLSPALPGAALMATFLAARFIPSADWSRATLGFAAAVCIVMCGWGYRPVSNSDWRDAASAINRLGKDTPVICPSPFVEAQSPAWRPDYPLPGFLYAHLPVYPLRGETYLFPFKASPEAQQYATMLAENVLPRAGRFAIYGGDLIVGFWRKWFEQRPELAGWSEKSLGSFGDVDVVLFERR